MKVGILGTGVVGNTLGTKLVQVRQQVMMGSRSSDNPKAVQWAEQSGGMHGTFSEAAAFGEIVFNCTAGTASLEAVEMAGAENLTGKILVDVANPLDFSRGFPPSLTVCNTDSLGEQIQRAVPDARVVKALNTMNCKVMVDPGLVPGDHHLFICGNDAAAKDEVAGMLRDLFEWNAESILDLGDITAARATEMYLPLWVRLYGKFGHGNINVQVHTG